MKEFYTNLNSLELIIFWGIILIIILLIILLIIYLKKKTKENDIEEELIEEFPIKLEEISNPEDTLINLNEEISVKEESSEEIIEITEEIIEPDYIEKLPEVENKEETMVSEPKETKKYSQTFEMPTAPYQRNVLREMSLSQTSPIGINRRDDYVKPKDLFELNKTEESLEIHEQNSEIKEAPSEEIIEKIEENHLEEIIEPDYIEEFSEEDNNLDIERTQYEIEQEENAIISYKELMEKKDSIQTIDEEDAIISIEELLNKNNKTEEEPKLYNISETEENDSFINELKQFRKDL